MRAKSALFVMVSATLVVAWSNAYAQNGAASNTSAMASGSDFDTTSPKQSDKQLAKTVRRALAKAKRRDLSFSNVRVRANNGVVTLTGTVPNRDQVNAAAQVVSGVPGVTSVDNRLTVHVELNGYGGQ